MDNQEEVKSSGKGKGKIVSIVVIILIIAAVGGYFAFGKNKPASSPSTPSVATVNGVVLTQSEYDAQLASAVATYKTQGVDVADPTKLSQIKAQVLDNMISNELVKQAAATAGVKVTAEDVEKQYQALVTQYGGVDKLNAELVKNNMTEAKLRENISMQLTAQTYLSQNIDTKSITATDAEISQFYTEYSKAQKDAGQKTIPTLKELSAQIKQQIISNKQQTLVANFIAGLKAKATITTATTTAQ